MPLDLTFDEIRIVRYALNERVAHKISVFGNRLGEERYPGSALDTIKDLQKEIQELKELTDKINREYELKKSEEEQKTGVHYF